MTLTGDFMLDVPAGNVLFHSPVNKFGHSPSGIQTTPTDFWDRADAVPTQQIWLPPTAARIHTIASTSILDDFSGGATGAWKVRIDGLTSWDTPESSEIIELDGAGANTQLTANAYVIIHRMECVAFGTNGKNAGTITATAAAPDSTVTAQIHAAEDNQTQMAIYGVPSTHSLYIVKYYVEIENAPGAAATIKSKLLVNLQPDVNLAAFVNKHTKGVQSTGTSSDKYEFEPYFRVNGPAIVKVEGTSSAADTDGSSGFDGILMTNG